MKFARHCCQLLLLAMLSPTVALALGLGDIHLKSSLDAPLDADIDLVDADAEDLSTLKAALASRDTFKHLGADYPSFLGTVTLTPERTPDGRAFIHVHSAGVAAEPFATLLVEVDWARGHLVREYTVLLDPPLYNSQAQTNPAVAAPVAGATAQSGAVEHAPSVGATTSPAPDTSASTSAAPATAAPAATTPEPSSPTNAATASNAAPPSADSATADNSAAPSTSAAPSASTAPPGSATPDNSAAQSAAATPPPATSETAANAAPSNAVANAASTEPAPSSAAPNSEASAPPKNEANAAPKSEANAGPTHADSYTVRAGDTLSAIAEQTYGTDRVTRDRALVAIYRANPKAFHANMNVLYTGSVLKLPGDSELEAIGPGDAKQEVRQQYDSWRGEHGGEQVASAGDNGHGQLRLVAPQEGAEQPAGPSSQPKQTAPSGAGNGAGSGAANAALQQRVQQLEAQLAESQRLLEMKNNELAALQARVQQEAANAHQPAAQPPVSVPPPPSIPAANPNQTATAPVSPPPAPTATPPMAQTPTPPPPAVTPPAAQPPAARPPHPIVAKRPHAAAPPASSNSIVDVVLQHWYVPAVLLLVLVGFLAVRWVRSRQEDAFDRSLGELTPAADEAARTNDTMPVRTMAGSRQEPSYRVEESGNYQRPSFEQAVESGPARSPEPVPAAAAEPPPPPPEAPVALDQGDPLAEADFHMAYGLYDQAAELVQIAITRDPKRRDLKMKLLEVFFVWGNRERFLQTAHQLAESRDQAPAGEWEKILIMGRQIAAEDPLFADSRGLAGAARVVDLNLEGGQNRVDFDLLGEPSLGTAATQESVALDLGAALGEPTGTEATGEALQMGDDSEEIILDAHDHSDGTGTTREMPEASGTTTSDVTALRPAPAGSGSTETMRIVSNPEHEEAPTVEQPQMRGGDQALRQKLDAHPGEQTAELAIDDLGLDLGALDEHTDEPATVDPDAPTLLADLDEDTRRMFEGAEAESSAPAKAHPAAQPVEAAASDVTQKATAAGGARPGATGTGTWMFTDTDFGAMAPSAKASPTVVTQITAQPETAATTALSALHSDELDLDLGNLESLKGQPSNGLDLDVGTPSAPSASNSYVDTQKLKADAALVSDDVALPDLEPVTLSEVGTKLDLARAYMDMGDPEGARSILAEVMSEGSMSQKQEARRLMDALPG